MVRGTAECLALVLALVPAAATAGTDTDAGRAGASPQPTRQTPDPALLEFLGTFQTADGRWIDPTRLADPPASGSGAARPGGRGDADGGRAETAGRAGAKQ